MDKISSLKEASYPTLFDFLSEIDDDEESIPEEWDFQKKILCIYGLALYLQEISKIKDFEGLLIPSSIFLDEEKIPLFNFSKPITDYGYDSNCQCKQASTNISKNIYSFGIISIIILLGKFSCFNENEGKGREIKDDYKKKIKKCTSPRFIVFLSNCVSESENCRPEINFLKNAVEEMIKKVKLNDELINKLKENIKISLSTLNDNSSSKNKDIDKNEKNESNISQNKNNKEEEGINEKREKEEKNDKKAEKDKKKENEIKDQQIDKNNRLNPKNEPKIEINLNNDNINKKVIAQNILKKNNINEKLDDDKEKNDFSLNIQENNQENINFIKNNLIGQTNNECIKEESDSSSFSNESNDNELKVRLK